MQVAYTTVHQCCSGVFDVGLCASAPGAGPDGGWSNPALTHWDGLTRTDSVGRSDSH